jgi:UDP-N-acetylglucosamine 3-dehydrogenase
VRSYTCAVIGTGSQGRVHARGYAAAGAQLVAVADPDRAAAAELAADFGIPGVYDSFTELFAAERPQVVSICTPPAFHLDVARAAAASGVAAIHCEKPIANSYADVLEMQRIADAAGVQLTVNLQRRFEPVHRFARDQIAAGAIGDVVSVEGYCPNLADWGSHIVDLLLFYLQDQPAAWVMGQVDVTLNRYVYGAFAETSSLTLFQWADGTIGLIVTGREPHTPVLNRQNNLGVIVQGTAGRLDARGAGCLIRRFGSEDVVFDSPFSRDVASWDRGVDPAIVAGTADAIADLLECLDTGRQPALRADHAVAGAEIVFATYESSRSRRRVALPLEPHDNALLSGLAEGFWQPVGELRATY